MNESHLLDEAAPPAPKRRRRLLGCGVALLVLFTACGGFYGFLVYSTDKDLRDAMAEADRQDPGGWQMDDLEAHRKVLADDENAALVVQAVKTKLPTPWPPLRLAPLAPGGLVEGGAPVLPPQQVYVDADLGDLPPQVQMDAALLRDLRGALDGKEAKDALAEAHKLPALRDGRFPISYSRDVLSTIISSQDARAAANLLRIEAVVLAQDGQADRALEATRGILVSARSVGDEPLMISLLIRVACDMVAVQALERVLAQGEPSAAELQKVQELLEAEAAEPLLYNAARGERAGMHQLMKALKSGDAKLSAIAGGGSAVADYAGPTLTRGSHPHVLRLMNEYVEIAKLPPEQQDERMKALEQKIKQAKVNYDIVTALVMPSIVKVAEAYRRQQAYLRCAIVAVAAERYRRDHGGWPATLEALAPEYIKPIPTDPYDGQPLRYKRLPDGAVVYSVGPDKKDDGGARNRANPIAKGIDYTFRLWDPAKRRQPPAEVLPPADESGNVDDEALP
jgi:hypothetical protein